MAIANNFSLLLGRVWYVVPYLYVIIGASRSEPHTYHSYEKNRCTYVCMCVCMYVRECVCSDYVIHVLIMQLRMCKEVSMCAHKLGKDRQRSPRVNPKINVAHLTKYSYHELWSSLQGVFEAD